MPLTGEALEIVATIKARAIASVLGMNMSVAERFIAKVSRGWVGGYQAAKAECKCSLLRVLIPAVRQLIITFEWLPSRKGDITKYISEYCSTRRCTHPSGAVHASLFMSPPIEM
jgi:hypothetical protein